MTEFVLLTQMWRSIFPAGQHAHVQREREWSVPTIFGTLPHAETARPTATKFGTKLFTKFLTLWPVVTSTLRRGQSKPNRLVPGLCPTITWNITKTWSVVFELSCQQTNRLIQTQVKTQTPWRRLWSRGFTCTSGEILVALRLCRWVQRSRWQSDVEPICRVKVRSAERWVYLIPRRNSTFGDRSFATAGPRVLNDMVYRTPQHWRRRNYSPQQTKITTSG